MGYLDAFQGFVIDSRAEWTKFRNEEFKPKQCEEHDDIAIHGCGVYDSDVHKILRGWGPCSLPLCVGHEVVGRVVRKGAEVSTVGIGDRVGIGAQVSALDKIRMTMPKALILLSNEGLGIGLIDEEEGGLRQPPGPSGGFGHYGIMWARAPGAETHAISHSPNKASDATALGATEFISTNATERFDMTAYMSTLAVNGTFHNVGLPDKPLPTMSAFDFMPGATTCPSTISGSRPEMLHMLQLASETKTKSWVQTMDISEEGCKEAVEMVHQEKAKYRIPLVIYDTVFGERA
ncbi:hypothetical protein EDB80DRAFT_745735 [Ilyonectria destructans]|nr:hypothetical protein EDB80DRAFT_745735 [Ilyonectria destructans]